MNYRVSDSVCLEMIASLGKTLEVIRDFNGRRKQSNPGELTSRALRQRVVGGGR
jgi:hypothetical protein